MIRWLMAALAATLALAPATAQVRVQDAAAALAQDAASYAAASGIAPDEALRQLRAQADLGPVTDALAAEFAGRLAGIAVEHRPFAVAVLLTGDAPVPSRVVSAGGTGVPVTFRTGAAATRDALLGALEMRGADLRAALAHPPGMGIDARTGTLAVLVVPADAIAEPPAAIATRLSALAGVPVSIRVLGQDEADMTGTVEGGGRVIGINPVDGRRYACTTGFTVTDGARTGVVTAAHCPDALSYAEVGAAPVPLDFVGQWGWGFQDVQVHASPQALSPTFFADTAKTLLRDVAAARSRAQTLAGDVVCHRGERTGYSCAEVVLTDFAPAGDLCGGACLPRWVAVQGPSCRAGDSGGPVFLGEVAYGIVKGGSYRADGRCGFYYYMSIDYLPDGWSLIRKAPPPISVMPAVSRPQGSDPTRPAVLPGGTSPG